MMQTLTAHEARTRFGVFIDHAQREPVRVMRYGRAVGVMVSAKDYEAMRVFYADRLRNNLCANAAEADLQGLSDAALATLLVDES